MMENCADYFIVCWAAQRLGLIYTPINWHLAAKESAYIIENCGAKALIVSENTRAVAQSISDTLHGVAVCAYHGHAVRTISRTSIGSYESAADGPDVGQYEGNVMFYSSGTTGRPKGISHKLDEFPGDNCRRSAPTCEYAYGMGRDTVYLVPAPLYHAAALGWTMLVLRVGGTVVVMEKFDALEALRLVEAHRVTHAQFVPTMFVRMLRLADHERRKVRSFEPEAGHPRGGAVCTAESRDR